MSMFTSKELERSNKISSSGGSSTSKSSDAVGHTADVESSLTYAGTSTDNSLKEDGCSTADTDITNSNAKKSSQNDDFSIQSQSQPQETTFPQQLMDLIESETTDDNAVTVHGQKAIEWHSTGDKFIIRDKVALESCVLPKYFIKKCKYMSFVRKLYRWGFRQVEKDFSSGVMIFMHKHFTRGDKKKCLAMHSIVNVKKRPAASIVATNASSNRRQGPRDLDRLPHVGDAANHLLQSNRQIYSGGNSILSNVGHGGTYNMLDRRVSPGLSMNYGLGMQMRMPHSNYLNNNVVLNWTIPGLVNNRSQVAQQPSLTATVAAALHANQGYSTAAPVSHPSAGISNIGRPSEEVNLAALIMNEDPTIDAWRALQLAKQHLNGTSTTSDPSQPN
mmetsp:Transcript_25855/g.39061  ORF Transcript_25855/g.39061 Transcript_25855/m.39061 type:complete len:389 (-) Transcript_25855:291-1457(-)